MDITLTPTPKAKVSMPAKLSSYTDDTHVSNYFKQLHDMIFDLNQRVIALEPTEDKNQ